MQPLSLRVRRSYLFVLMFLFILILPIVIFYADGYRYKPGIGFRQTGGIFISVPYSGAEVFFNGKVIGRSSFLDHSFYIDNLTAGTYTVLVEREGSIPWIRALYVEPQLVTDARVLLVPVRANVIRLITVASVATSTRTISVADLVAIRGQFGESATTTVGLSGESLVIENGNVYDRITQVTTLPASNFCRQPSYCVREIPIEISEDESNAAAFFHGGVVYSTKESGVFFAEADIRPSPATTNVYPRRGAEFRIVGESLIVKDGNSFYEIIGL